MCQVWQQLGTLIQFPKGRHFQKPHWDLTCMLKNIVAVTVLQEVPPSLTLRTTYNDFEHMPFLRPNRSSHGLNQLEELFHLLLLQSVHSTGNMNQEAQKRPFV